MAATVVGGWQKVMCGPVDVYLKAYAADNDPVTGNVADYTGWSQIKLIAPDGFSHKIAREGKIAKVQELGNVASGRVGLGGELEVAIEQCPLAAIPFAIPGATYTAGATPGTNPNIAKIGLGTEAYCSAAIEGVNEGGLTCVYLYHKVKPQGALDQSFQIGEVTVMPLKFDLFVDPAQSAGEELVTIYELTEAS